jgi:DNA-binding GntR family transcriptional regulator
VPISPRNTGMPDAVVPRKAEDGLPSIVGASVREEATRILRDAIWRGQLRPGEHLNELVLSAALGVSRPPLREAIRTLEGEGLVVSQPRRGSYVKRLSGQDVVEIYSLRCTLEGMAAELIIDANSGELVDELEALLDELETDMVGQRELYDVITTDLRFHWSLVHAAYRCGSVWSVSSGSHCLWFRRSFSTLSSSSVPIARSLQRFGQGIVRVLQSRSGNCSMSAEICATAGQCSKALATLVDQRDKDGDKSGSSRRSHSQGHAAVIGLLSRHARLDGCR